MPVDETTSHKNRTSARQMSALAALAFSLLAIAASQLVIKWRFGTLAGTPAANGEFRLVAAVLGDPWLWLGAVLVISGAIAWYVALSRLPVSFMMPTAGLVAPLTSFGAWWFLGESMTAQKCAAIAIILFGVIWLHLQQGAP